MEEKIKERGKTFKVFQVDKKHKRFEVRCKPIHYKDSEHQWQDIDVSLNLINNPTKNHTDFLALKNTFTLGFRGDKLSKKFSGIRYKGSPNYQYEITPISIQFDNDVVTIPETFKKVLLLDKYNIEHIITDDVSLCTKVHESYTQSTVKTSRHINSFKILEQLNLVGFKIINAYKKTKNGKNYIPTTENEFIFATDELITEKIRIPQPKMWNENEGISRNSFSEGIKHTLYEKDGILYYEKNSNKEGGKWLREQNGTIYLDETSYYGDTSDGYTESENNIWSALRSQTGVDYKSNTASSYNMAITASDEGIFIISRDWFWFDTSAIADGDTVTAVDLKVYGYSYTNSDVCAMLSVQNETYANWTLNAFSGSEYGHTASWSTTYNTITFNTQGKSDVNKTGMTKICCREYTHDYSNSEPTTYYNNGCYFADQTGTSQDPYLIVTVEAGGTEYFDTVEIDIDTTPTKSADFDFKKTLSASETSIFTKSVGFQRTLDISGTMTPTELFKFLNTFSVSGTHSPTLSSLFGVTKAFSSSMAPTTLKVITFKQTPIITEISTLSILKKYFLEKTFSSSSTLDTSILHSILSSLTGTGTPTIIDTLGYYAVPTFQTTASLSIPLKFLLIKTLITETVLTITDIYTLASIISTTINNIPGVSCKFKLIISNTGLGTPSVSSILGKFDIVSFEIQGTSSLTKVMNYSPIITVEISEQFFINALQTLIKNVTFATTGVPTASRKDLLEVLFTEISILSSLVKFSLEQNLIQTNTATVDKIISFIKDIEMSSTSSLSIEDILEFILTIPLSTSQNITIEGIQTLIDLISTSTQENLSTSIKNILSILLQETSIFSSILKFFIVKTITSDILSTIYIAVSYRDTMLLTIENVSLVTLLEELAKLVLTLSDTQLKDLTLEDSQIINLTLSDTQLKDLTLEDSQIINLTLSDTQLKDLTLEDL